LRLTLNVYFFAVLLRVILSWVMPYGLHRNPAGDLLASLTEPLMRPARRLIPAVGGLDLSPIVVLVALQLLQLALAHLLR
jgi:YggT family protein